jgi:hypothetical protein
LTFASPELGPHELVVVEVLVGNAQPLALGAFRPAGLFIGAAVGTSAGLGGDFRAALGTDFWRRSHTYPG